MNRRQHSERREGRPRRRKLVDRRVFFLAGINHAGSPFIVVIVSIAAVIVIIITTITIDDDVIIVVVVAVAGRHSCSGGASWVSCLACTAAKTFVFTL